MKLLILCEQWPYRMSLLFEMVENLQQEEHISKWRLKHEPCSSANENLPIGKFLTEFVDGFSILTAYHLLVEGLIHLPIGARLQLQRDTDPQVFEMLLSQTLSGVNEGILLLNNIALPDEVESQNS